MFVAGLDWSAARARRQAAWQQSFKWVGNNVRLSAAQAPFVLRTFATSARSKSDRRSPERQMAHRHVPARHLNASSDKKSMSRIVLVTAVLICGSLFVGCSRKPAQTAPPPPEVLVTTVRPQDVPRVLERVATLDGFINANINAQVQGYIVSRDYQEGSVEKKGDLLFQIDPRPFEAALAQAKGTLAKDQANQIKAGADKKRAIDLLNKRVISDQARATAVAANH